MKTHSKPSLRQTMAIFHTWTGLLLGWLLFSMFLTGTVSYFRDEISQWMRPELAQPHAQPDMPAVSEVIERQVAELATGASQWSFTLPDARQSLVSASWRNDPTNRSRNKPVYFDATTGERVQPRETRGGDFFYRFHFEFYNIPYPWGRWVAGLAAMFMLVAIISGVITHKKFFTDFFTFREGKGLRSWLDAHSVLSVFGLPFHVMITYTGLVTLMSLYMPWSVTTGINTPALKAQYDAQTQAVIRPAGPNGVSAPLTAVGPLVREAEARWGQGQVGRVIVMNSGDSSARIALERSKGARVSTSPQTLIFDGVSGRLLQEPVLIGPAAQTRGVMYGLHMGRFADASLRWMYFLVSLAGTAMVGTGLVMWTMKRRLKLRDPQRPHLGFRVVEKLNITTIAGLPLAMTAMLWANRLLPLDLGARSAWEIRVFFIAWGLSLIHALARRAKRAWVEQFWLVAIMQGLLPVISWLTTGRWLWHSIAARDWTFVGVDLMLWCFALFFAILAIRTKRHIPPAKLTQKSRQGITIGAMALRAPDRAGNP